MKKSEWEAACDAAQESFNNDVKLQQKIKDSSDKELIHWVVDALLNGEPEVMPIAAAILKEANSRGGKVAKKVNEAWDVI